MFMYLIPVAWLYVALMMAVAEATSTIGTVLGSVITFVLYGLGPVALVLYLIGTPARRRAIKKREAAEMAAAKATAASVTPDTGGHAAADPVTPVRKEP